MMTKDTAVKNPHPTGNLEAMFRKGIALVDFNAPWCVPCEIQKPIVAQLAGRYREKARIITLDVDENKKAAIRLGITSIPTLILFKNGREIQRFVGLQPVEVLSKAIENVLK